MFAATLRQFLIIVSTMGIITPGDTGTYSISLNSAPSANVQVRLYPSSGVSLSVSTLTFTPENYSTAQNVVVTPTNTSTTKGINNYKIQHATISADNKYNNLFFVKTVSALDAAYDEVTLSYTPNFHIEATDASVSARRDTAINWVFLDGTGMPDGTVDTILNPFSGDTYFDCTSSALSHMERYALNLKKGDVFYAYHMFSNNPNGKLVLAPMGHGDLWSSMNSGQSYNLLHDSLLVAGYDVIAAYMVGRGSNTPSLISHRYQADEAADYNPMDNFLAPWFRLVNYFENDYTDIYAVGISGGGWTTTWITALDTRIKKGISVSGEHPIALRGVASQEDSNGDYEQGGALGGDRSEFIEAGYADKISWEDMYVLAAQGRKFYQARNKDDSCCFSTLSYQLWEDHVKLKVGALQSGEYGILPYTQSCHCYNTTILSDILGVLNN